MAEWLRRGLQNLVRRFNSGCGLQNNFYFSVKKERKILSFVFLAAFVSALFFISISTALAQEIKVEKTEAKPITFTPQITIPGSEIFKKGVPFTITKETMPTMARDLYRFLVGSAGIVAVIVMMAGGYYWLFAGGNTGRVTQAKEYIGGAVLGLTLSLGSFMILNMINPELINMKKFEIPTVPKITVLGIIECPGDSLTLMTESVGLDFQMITSTPYFNDQLISGLKTAGAKAYTDGYQLVVTSGFREPLDQKFLYDKAVKEYGKDAGKYACDGDGNGNFCSCPHTTGGAVDVCMKFKNGSTATGCDSAAVNKNMNGKNNYQKILQDIMKFAGFTRYCGEWWHFEIPSRSESCDPGVYK